MSSESFDELAAAARRRVEQRCAELVARLLEGPPGVREAVEYSLLGGGKRLRPLLCLWTHEACAGDRGEACLDVACAIECLHTYSLVHDDLPCMDDDDMRRGRASCHKQFGEAMAVLAGDALMTLCFEILVTVPDRVTLDSETLLDVMRVVSGAAGGGGLIMGQALDLASTGQAPELRAVDKIHHYKTAALISAAMECGAVLAGVDNGRRNQVKEAGYRAGRAFQIVDDVLDLEADPETLGKTPGKDARAGKLTYPALAGVEASTAQARKLLQEARLLVGAEPSKLLLLLDSVVRRSN